MSTEDQLVSVVIPVRNGEKTIGQQLKALAAQNADVDWELVVANNESTDDTVRVVEEHRSRFHRVTVTATEGGLLGINVARNVGVRAAAGRRILICDADDVVQPGWISGHLEALRSVDICGGPLDHHALNPAHVADFNKPTLANELPVCGQFLPYAVGCNFAFRREVWARIGGFDDAWQRGCTEVEFCWRAQLAGFTIGWTDQAVVSYRKGDTLKEEMRRRYRSAKANARLFKSFADSGMPRTSARAAARAWLWLVYRAPWMLVGADWQKKWLQVLAWRGGLVAGSLRYGVRYF